MKKIFMALSLSVLLAAGCNIGNSQLDTMNTEPETTVYTNTENKYELDIPDAWIEIDNADGSNNLLNFKTVNNREVYLVRNNFGPMDMPTPPEDSNVAMIGQETGYVESGYHCGDGSNTDGTCTGVLIYQSPKMSEKGFALEFHIDEVPSEEMKSGDPYTDFQEDVKNIEAVLKTFRFFIE